MQNFTPTPDLSLNISLPSVVSDCEAKPVGFYNGLITSKTLYNDICSTSDSGSSTGSELSQENGFFRTDSVPILSLGFETPDLMNNPQPVQGLPRNVNHQPHIYGREFKRNARVINGAKRSIRAPRMRWTSTLHAHFVHAVQLLGGHESKIDIPVKRYIQTAD